MKVIIWIIGLILLIGGNIPFISHKCFPANLPFVFIGGLIVGNMIAHIHLAIKIRKRNKLTLTGGQYEEK